MNVPATVGIIGGAGWLGQAIVAHGLASGVLNPASLVISSRSSRNGRFPNWPEITWTSDNQALANRADVVVLSVRPEQFTEMSIDVDGRLVISVMAGVSVATLQARLNTDRVIRCMPNAAAEIGQSYTPWLASSAVTDDDRTLVDALMGSCGEVDEVDTEDLIDYLSGLSGSGPAFPALLASAMLSHAKARGLSPQVAKRAVKGVMHAARLLAEADQFNPQQAVKIFVDYDGTTAAGLAGMMQRGFVESVHAHRCRRGGIGAHDGAK